MNLTDAIPQDELTLARLTASKLGKIMHGLMSVGTGSLGLGAPKDFLTGRDKAPLGFLEVLATIGVKPGHAEMIPLLRDKVRELADVVTQFHGQFIELANWRNMSEQEINVTVERLGDSYALFCERLGAFCSILGMGVDFTQQAIQDTNNLVGFFNPVST